MPEEISTCLSLLKWCSLLAGIFGWLGMLKSLGISDLALIIGGDLLYMTYLYSPLGLSLDSRIALFVG